MKSEGKRTSSKCGPWRKTRVDKEKNKRALVLILPVEFHCRCVVRICSQVLLVNTMNAMSGAMQFSRW